jgi:hypothetical protein
MMKIFNLKFAVFCSLLVGILAFLSIEQQDQNLAADDYGFSNEVNPIEGLQLVQNDSDLDLEIRTDKYTMEIPTVYITTTQGYDNLISSKSEVKSSRYVTSTSYTLEATTQGNVESEFAHTKANLIKLAAL